MSHNNKIFYITRSYPSGKQHGGGSSLLREAAVKLLRKSGFVVTVITPNFGSSQIKEDKENGIVFIPYNENEKLGRLRQRLGLIEDYLDKWVENSMAYLTGEVSENDIAFCTTGGELASVKLSFLMKKQFRCHNVVNFRDPINYAHYSGLKRDNLFHINRNNLEKKYLSNVDLIITSCDTFRKELIKKYSSLSDKIFNNYFGYIGSVLRQDEIEMPQSEKLRIVYGGNFSRTQSPEQICEVVSKHPQKEKIDLTLIGNSKGYRPINKYLSEFNFIDKIPRSEFSSYLLEYADVGYVPLKGEYYKYCFPSKIFEYLNHGLVILGALSDGDAMEFINSRKYGIAVENTDNKKLQQAITTLLDNKMLSEYRRNIFQDNDKLSMNELIRTTIERLNNL